LDDKTPVIGQYYSQILQDDLRNHMIVEDVLACVKERRTCLLLSERTQHVQLLESLLKNQVPTVHILTGGKSAAEAKRQLDALRNAPDETPLIVCATGKYIGEGFDEARLDTLFLTMPISWHGTLAQYAGRLHRLHDEKREVRVYDYIDHSAEMLEKMYHKRLKGYAAI
jgi:superfamily II DNA or RNA helicase